LLVLSQCTLMDLEIILLHQVVHRS
jgi:hypothetical protein